MSKNGRVKIVGYAQRKFFNDGIEYRNFSDDLVGNQQTVRDNESSSLFTMGNFVVTTNLSDKASRNFATKKFSNFFCLSEIGIEDNSALLDKEVVAILNLDNTELCNYAYFGSATEFIRVSLENIISNWPASLWMKPVLTTSSQNLTGYTVENYVYDSSINVSTFQVNTNFIDNKFDIIYEQNGETINAFSPENNLRNLTVNYASYVVFYKNVEYPILGFTGSTTKYNGTLYFEVKGNPFSNTNETYYYHVKPNKTKEEEFFQKLPPFENNLLDRLTSPKFTSKYQYNVESDNGEIYVRTKTLTWPVSDGYNIDFNTTQYANYVSGLLEVTEAKDALNSNLIVRFLTSESISDFDTVPKCDGSEEETAGQKMNKTLKIYGRAFDEVKKYIDGLAYVHTVTYNKKNNTPDQVVKSLSKLLGWELTSSIVENDLLKSYVNSAPSTYEGQSRGLTASEAEIELWRRLILNSAWIWKSKGTRKAVEFLFKFIGMPYGLISLDEFIYQANAPINMEIFKATLEALNLDTDIDNYLVDSDGYPKFLPDTSEMYFQKGGGWYRDTGGSGATEYILDGNNPHVGPYDRGKAYFNQLKSIIPNFEPVILTATTVSTGTTELFTNYNSGRINNVKDYGGTATGTTVADLQAILSAETVSCLTARGLSLSSCTITGEWKIILTIDGSDAYEGEIFYTSENPSDPPSSDEYINALQKAVINLGLSSTISGSTITFTDEMPASIECLRSSYLGKSLGVSVSLDIRVCCI